MLYLEKICCFFILARLFLHMCPNEKYEKYLGVLTTWVAFSLFLTPFLEENFLEKGKEQWEMYWEMQVENDYEEKGGELEERTKQIAEGIVKDVAEEMTEDVVEEIPGNESEKAHEK